MARETLMDVCGLSRNTEAMLEACRPVQFKGASFKSRLPIFITGPQDVSGSILFSVVRISRVPLIRVNKVSYRAANRKVSPGRSSGIITRPG